MAWSSFGRQTNFNLLYCLDLTELEPKVWKMTRNQKANLRILTWTFLDRRSDEDLSNHTKASIAAGAARSRPPGLHQPNRCSRNTEQRNLLADLECEASPLGDHITHFSTFGLHIFASWTEFGLSGITFRELQQ